MSAQATYPVHVEAELEPALNRWLWLVKWLLVIPHYLVLAFLWLAFAVTSVVAFFAILVTGRYPRAIFDYNVGVMRWSWRVAYYAYGALGTDRYPPFTLADVPDYPAHLDVDYPDHLSRGLVLVKWWLLALPHYLIVSLLLGGFGWAAQSDQEEVVRVGLLGLLVLIAGVTLLFTGRYPQPLFDLVLGLNRWAIRVAGYVALMTDSYPPFRLDQGGHEAGPDSPVIVPPDTPALAAARPVAAPPHVWTAGRVVSLVVGALLVLCAAGLGTGSGLLLLVDRNGRDDAGFVMSGTQVMTTPTFAITSGDVHLHADGPQALMPKSVVGDAKLTVTPLSGEPIFVGVAPSADVRAYLAGVESATLVTIRDGDPVFRVRSGGAPSTEPAVETFWTVQAVGQGAQTVTWPVENGDWTAVVMNGDGSAGIMVEAAAGAEVPALRVFIVVAAMAAALLLLIGITLVASAVSAASRAGQPSAAPPL